MPVPRLLGQDVTYPYFLCLAKQPTLPSIISSNLRDRVEVTARSAFLVTCRTFITHYYLKAAFVAFGTIQSLALSGAHNSNTRCCDSRDTLPCMCKHLPSSSLITLFRYSLTIIFFIISRESMSAHIHLCQYNRYHPRRVMFWLHQGCIWNFVFYTAELAPWQGIMAKHHGRG